MENRGKRKRKGRGTPSTVSVEYDAKNNRLIINNISAVKKEFKYKPGYVEITLKTKKRS